jgi:hypothetical protein
VSPSCGIAVELLTSSGASAVRPAATGTGGAVVGRPATSAGGADVAPAAPCGRGVIAVSAVDGAGEAGGAVIGSGGPYP